MPGTGGIRAAFHDLKNSMKKGGSNIANAMCGLSRKTADTAEQNAAHSVRIEENASKNLSNIKVENTLTKDTTKAAEDTEHAGEQGTSKIESKLAGDVKGKGRADDTEPVGGAKDNGGAKGKGQGRPGPKGQKGQKGGGGQKKGESSKAPEEYTGDKIVTDENGNKRLKNADQAIQDPRKYTEYALNRDHPVGGNKARVFEAATGYTKDNAEELRGKIAQGIQENEPKPGKVDQYGERFTVEVPVTGPTGSGSVTTGWIYHVDNPEIPSLTTLLMKGKK